MNENEKKTKGKRYYWIKLKKDFFKDIRMMKADSMENGKVIIVIYLKILLESLVHDGTIYHMGIEQDIAGELSLVTGETKEEIKRTLEFLEKVGCIKINEDKTISMLMLDDMVGSETASAKSMRKTRAKAKTKAEKEGSQCDNNVKQCDTEKDIEKEKEKDKKLEKEIYGEGENVPAPLANKKTYGVFENVFLTDDEYEQLYDIMGYEFSVKDHIDYLSSYMKSHGKENQYKDHFATLIKWYKEDQKKAKQERMNKGIYTVEDYESPYNLNDGY